MILAHSLLAQTSPANDNAAPRKAQSALRSLFGGGDSASGIAALTQEQTVQGLREALEKGLKQAVDSLGRTNGFLTNALARIPMPEELKKVEAAMRSLKQDELADTFVATMNRAAELAVPEAAAVFADAVRQMTIADAKSILTGPDDAATEYFRRTSQTNLYARFLPIVRKSTESAGATAAFKKIVEQSKSDVVAKKLGRLRGLGAAFGFSAPDPSALDLDDYVTNGALDGLFKMVAQEEKLIRRNPQARTTEILQKVFGAAKK
jgi:hypothetical protein